MPADKMTFEEALERLEKLIGSLEKGDLSLEQSLEKFKEGMELTRHCRKLLAEAEYRIEMILQDGEASEFKLNE